MQWTVFGMAHPPWRIRTVLVWLMLTCLIPGVLGAGFLFVHEYQLRRSQLERDALAVARALAQAVDSRLAVAYGAPDRLALGDFQTILAAQKLPAQWVGVIFDRTGTIVARTHAQETFVGQKGTAEYIERILRVPEGIMQTVTREGIPTVSVWSRSPLTGWSVGIGIPRELLDRDLNTSMGYLALGIIVVLGVSLALAVRVGRSIAASVYALTEPAAAMIDGRMVNIAQQSILETAQIAQEIRQATELLRARADALAVANRELERLAHIDTLTGLRNRLSMNEAMRCEFMRFGRTHSHYAVLFMDIDFFKRINDTYGHEQGDRVLSEVAACIRQSLRATDCVARYGGEEFLAMLPDTDSNGREAVAVAEKVRQQIAEQVCTEGCRVTVSIGVAVVEATDPDAQAVVHRADCALYDAKASGRNRVCLFGAE